MNENNFIVDRIEGDKIVLENNNEEIIVIDKQEINTLPKEGDILVKIDKKYIIDSEATEKRKNKIRDMMKGLWVE